jgi:hypothetical protein
MMLKQDILLLQLIINEKCCACDAEFRTAKRIIGMEKKWFFYTVKIGIRWKHKIDDS